MSFTLDWFSGNIPQWQKDLKHLEGEPVKALEIGSFEGMATRWLLQNILTHDDSVITCIDTFGGSAEHENKVDFSEVEKRFDQNAYLPFRGKVKKIKDTSFNALVAFNSGYVNEKYDFVYIDGSHQAKDVLTDALLVWPLVKGGGIVTFDDYLWGGYPDQPTMHPKLGIDSFLAIMAGKFELIHHGYQVTIKKTAD